MQSPQRTGAWRIALSSLYGLALAMPHVQGQGILSGNFSKWERVTIDFAGPSAQETDGRSLVTGDTAIPNPFLDYRLQVLFTSPSGDTYNIPGFFAGDGQGGRSGDIWRVHFTPDEVGEWGYSTSFRQGVNVAIETAPFAGTPYALQNGGDGNFTINDTSPTAPGHYATGRLESVPGYYLKSRDGGYWLKNGISSPENFLGYDGFDNTTKGPTGAGVLHRYLHHDADWQAGDPVWDSPDSLRSNDSHGILGAINYLASQGVNSLPMLPMNIGGTGQETHPFAATNLNLAGSPANDNLHYDVSKLEQWEQVFSHAQAQNMMLHVMLSDGEKANKRELDNATLSIERKLFYREMVARFGHHNALQWNLSKEYLQENGFGTYSEASTQLFEFADYLSAIDPYNHPLTVQTGGSNLRTRLQWAPFLGQPHFDVTSLSYPHEAISGPEVELFRSESAMQGRPIPIFIDLPQALDLIAPISATDTRADAVRRLITWDMYLSGGAGLEWFVDSQDQSFEDFREQEQVWREADYARRFVLENLPFWDMEPADELLRYEEVEGYGGGEVLALAGEVYALYLPEGSNDNGPSSNPPELNLEDYPEVDFQLQWFNPRTGVFDEAVVPLTGGGWASIGATPDGKYNGNDWAALITRVTATLPGDYNGDGIVDAADYTLWRDTMGMTVALGSGADGHADGIIDELDYVMWKNHFGERATTNEASFVPLPVPEPQSAIALLLAAGLLGRMAIPLGHR